MSLIASRFNHIQRVVSRVGGQLVAYILESRPVSRTKSVPLSFKAIVKFHGLQFGDDEPSKPQPKVEEAAPSKKKGKKEAKDD